MHLRRVINSTPLLGSPVVPFYPFSFWVPLLKPNSRKKGTLIIRGLLGNLDYMGIGFGAPFPQALRTHTGTMLLGFSAVVSPRALGMGVRDYRVYRDWGLG